MRLKTHAAHYGAPCALCRRVFVSSAATASLPAVPGASSQPNWSGGEATGFADQLEQFNTAHDEATSPKAAEAPSSGFASASRQSTISSKGVASNVTAQPGAKSSSASSIAQNSQGSPTLPPTVPLTYTGASGLPIRQITLADSETLTANAVADSSFSAISAAEPPQTNATGASNPAAAKATKSAGKDVEKQPRTNQDAVPPILAPIGTQVAPQASQPLSIGLPADADTSDGKDGPPSSHAPAVTSPLAAAEATSGIVSLMGEENTAAKTAPNGKSSSTEDQSSVPDDLTFAARVQTGAGSPKAPSDPARRAGADSAQAVRHGASETGKNQTSETSVPVSSQPTAAAVAQRFDVAAPRAESNNPVAPQVTQPAPGTQPLQTDEAAVTKAPLKDISFQVGQAQGQKVEVRVTEHAGELRVAVRTGDTDVAQGLRQGLSDLTAKLTENGYRAETWRPGDLSALTSTSAKEASDTPGQSPNGGSQPQSHSQPQSGAPQQDRGQQNQNPSNRPRWVQELETTLRGGTGSTGDFNGLIS